jgi:hypothetical protein
MEGISSAYEPELSKKKRHKNLIPGLTALIYKYQARLLHDDMLNLKV